MTEHPASVARRRRWGTSSRIREFAILLLGVALVVTAIFGTYLLLQRMPSPPKGWLAVFGVALLLAFLILLLARYALLAVLGYLQHIEARVREGDPATVDELEPVTLIVPAFNEGPVIENALRSLLQLDYPAYEILVVDDGSTDDTAIRVAAMEGRYGDVVIRLVRRDNGGKAAALNTGIQLARHRFVLCMDGDSRLSRNTLRAAMPHFRDPHVAAVAGNVKVVNRNNLWTRLQALEYVEGLNMARRAQAYLRSVNIIPGPVGLFRREVLLEVGGYETDTFAEDADLTLRLLRRGWRIVYEDQAIAYTEAPEKLRDLLKQRYRWTRGILQALAKQLSGLLWPSNGPAVFFSLHLMFFEALLWPAANIIGNLAFVILAVTQGGSEFVILWWVLLTILDVMAALYTVAMEEEDLKLVLYAPIYRLFFIVIIDVTKLCATVEQLLGVRMTWGKLDRAGRI